MISVHHSGAATAVGDVSPFHRAVGHPAAPLTAQGLVAVIQALLVAIDRLTQRKVTDAELVAACHNHPVMYAQYAADQAQLAAAAPASDPDMGGEAGEDEQAPRRAQFGGGGAV